MTLLPGTFDVRAGIEALLSDDRYDEYTVAMAYIDGDGARVLEAALARGTGGVESKHSTDVEYPPSPHRICMRIHT